MLVKTKDGLHPFEAFYVPERFVQKALRELNENPENKPAALEQLREFVLGDKDLRCTTSDEYLEMFLRARKYNVSRSFALIKKNSAFRRKNAGIFQDMEYDILSKVIKQKIFSFLPYRDKEGCAVLFVRFMNWNPSDLNVAHLSRAIVVFLFHSICDPLTQINGYQIIFDVRSNPLKHLRQCTPHNLYLIYNGTQECFPGRFKGFHILNMSITFKTAWAIASPFLSDKIKKRFTLHKNNESLLDHFPESIIPADYSGVLKDYETCACAWLKNAMQPDNLEKIQQNN